MKFKKKPVTIKAIQYLPPHNCEEVYEFTQIPWEEGHDPEDTCDEDTPMYIKTLEGLMRADPGDWIIKGVRGEYYPCKPDIFNDTYEKAE